jgi:hypothetical protein
LLAISLLLFAVFLLLLPVALLLFPIAGILEAFFRRELAGLLFVACDLVQ